MNFWLRIPVQRRKRLILFVTSVAIVLGTLWAARSVLGLYFIGLVLQTAFYLSVASYVPGLLLSAALYKGLAEYTGLLMIMNLPRAGLVFVLTLGMCVVSGCLAVRKVLAADPADLF